MIYAIHFKPYLQNKNAMHSFLDEYTGRHQVFHVGYQLAIKKSKFNLK
jgi:hypothetical protein